MATGTRQNEPQTAFERLKKERTQVRRMFTISIAECETAFLTNEVGDVSDCFATLFNKAERLFNLDEKVKEMILDGVVDFTEDEVNKEFDSIESYYDKWLKLKNRYDRFITPTEPTRPLKRDEKYASSESFRIAEGCKRKYRLPKIEFEKFDGNVRNWINFWGQFRKIHEDLDLDDDDKYRYLLLATSDIANTVVKKHPSSGYEKAVDHLKSRFGKDEILIEVYVRELLRIVLQKSGSNLAELVDQLETQLGALELLGVTSDKYACTLYPIVESALPEDVLKAWERNRSAKKDMNESKESADYLKLLLAFLRCEVESEERIRLASSGFQSTTERKANSRKGFKENELSEPTAASLTTTATGDTRVKISSKKGVQIIRALLDTGSQKSYVTKQCAINLGLKKEGEEILAHSLFGGILTGREAYNMYRIRVVNLENAFNVTMSVLEKDKICNFVPRLESLECISELRNRNIVLSDVGGHRSDIDLLIGADVIGKLMTGEVYAIPNGLTAVGTKLGWTVMGQSNCSMNGTTSTNVSLCFLSIDISDLWRLDVLGITDPCERKTTEKLAEETLEHFRRNVTRKETNRYEVRLPWMDGRPKLSDNYEVSVKRLMSTTRKLKPLSKLKDYHKVFAEWLELEIVEQVPSSEIEKREGCHYIPHQAVIKESSVTTKIRPVFDASAKDANGNSLNTCLATGPNLLEKIPNLLINFRQKAIGVISDITKAFLQISIAPSDRDLLRFLWWEDERAEKLTIFRHCRVVFGLTPSPFLLEATIAHHLDNAPLEFQGTANRLKNTFYVDNSITSVDNKEELDKFMREAKQVMKMGCFELRGSVSNLSEQGTSEFTEKETVSVLGLLWNYNKDTLYCDISSVSLAEKPITRRKLLSVAQRVFDPIGFTCPVTLIPKLLLQQTWELKCGWDDELPHYVSEKFERWLAEVHWLNHCQIPRWFMEPSQHSTVSVHVFTDGSKEAYSGCVFLRAEYPHGVSVQLISAKSRIAPLKKLTIPRMELMGALIGARLYSEVKKSLQIQYTPYFWTDSSVVLTWLKWKNDWNTFVSNRCREISSLTTTEWRHVPGEFNPADLPSRGCFGERLSNSRWWEGPEWLKRGHDGWPSRVIETPEEDALIERRKTVISSLTCQSDLFSERLGKLSCYFRVIRVAAWVRRGLRKFMHLKEFILEVKEETLPKTRVELFYDEIEEAERRVLLFVQQEGFSTSDEKMFKRLQSYHDEHGLRRIRSRLLLDEKEEESFTRPILLPAGHHIVNKLIMSEHLQAHHAGPQILMCILRQRYWITKARKLIRSVLIKCSACQRFRAKAAEPPVAPLPKDRVTMGGVFEVTGVDVAGPLLLKDKSKVWIVLFTCAVYRAVHLELTTSLSTEAFLQVLRRFIARRGRVRVVYSDNATNFVGANNALQALDWDKVITQTTMKRIQWKFNPPAAPWWGGWWERLIGLMKDLLRRNLGKASLSYEELATVLCDCEAILNSRPLTYIYQESGELHPLTPAHFIYNNSCGSEVPDWDAADANGLRKRAKYIQKVRDSVRQRFRNEYLAMLVHLAERKTRTLKVGDVVLVGADNVKRINWPLGVVTELCRGHDGQYRVAKVCTATSEFIRAFQRLYPLEIEANFYEKLQEGKNKTTEEDVGKGRPSKKEDKRKEKKTKSEDQSFKEPVPLPVTTKCGRRVKKPLRFSD